MIEELHRPLKSAIKCHATERWTEVLPIILLGLRASLKEDILCTPAELVFGTTIRLPGEMFDSSKPDDDVVNFVSKLKSHMQSLHPKPPKHHGKRPVFIHPGLLEATHVFLRRDMLRRPLQQPYNGPFKVLQMKDKVFFLDINGKRVSVSIDRCKPAFFLNTEDLQLPQTKNETPATVEPNATASTPATVESDPTASTPTQPSTRSGRKVHLPTSEECLTTQRGKTKPKHHSVYSIEVSDMKNSYAYCFEELSEKKICGFISKIEDKHILNELKNKEIILSDLNCKEAEIGLLIGADNIGKLLTKNLIEFDSGLTAIETKLGWTVIGKVCSNDKNVMLTTSSLHVRNVSVKELWELDVLGITDPLLNENTKENFELTDFLRIK
ncbi:integrase catalytic domain-containing protein [Trichonephila clavipes]|nr:integrase catalytic domain-containing protein [Trichonephila clavipes]